jgi:tetratricopeptide (TPR) repeat protein
MNTTYQKDHSDHDIANYTKAIELDPNNADAYEMRGNAYMETGQYDLAEADYARADELESDQEILDDTEALKFYPQAAWLYFSRGDAYAIKGKYDQAIMEKKSWGCQYSKTLLFLRRYSDEENNGKTES